MFTPRGRPVVQRLQAGPLSFRSLAPAGHQDYVQGDAHGPQCTDVDPYVSTVKDGRSPFVRWILVPLCHIVSHAHQVSTRRLPLDSGKGSPKNYAVARPFVQPTTHVWLFHSL